MFSPLQHGKPRSPLLFISIALTVSFLVLAFSFMLSAATELQMYHSKPGQSLTN